MRWLATVAVAVVVATEAAVEAVEVVAVVEDSQALTLRQWVEGDAGRFPHIPWSNRMIDVHGAPRCSDIAPRPHLSW